MNQPKVLNYHPFCPPGEAESKEPEAEPTEVIDSQPVSDSALPPQL